MPDIIYRYPEAPLDGTPELKRAWEDLIRTLVSRDKTPLHPYDVYKRTVVYGGASLSGLTSLGYINTGTPDGGYWNVYEFDIPRDVGTVLVEDPAVAPRGQIRAYLPKASLVEGRTISIIAKGNGSTTFNLAVGVVAGDSMVYYNPPNPYVSTGVSVHFATGGASPYGLPLYAYVAADAFGAGIPATPKILPVGTYNAGSGVWNGPLTDAFDTSVSTTTSATERPAWTFRAYGDTWYHIP